MNEVKKLYLDRAKETLFSGEEDVDTIGTEMVRLITWREDDLKPIGKLDFYTVKNYIFKSFMKR